MAIQTAYSPKEGNLIHCLSVIVDVLPEGKVEIECTQLKEKVQRDIVPFVSLAPVCSWSWEAGKTGLPNVEVKKRQLSLKCSRVSNFKCQ